jgi:hypothetical protein
MNETTVRLLTPRELAERALTNVPIELGDTAIDQITGFSGVVTGRVQYITGCDQLLLQPMMEADGKQLEARWVDVQRCGLLPSKRIVLDNSRTPGPDVAPPIR